MAICFITSIKRNVGAIELYAVDSAEIDIFNPFSIFVKTSNLGTDPIVTLADCLTLNSKKIHTDSPLCTESILMFSKLPLKE